MEQIISFVGLLGLGGLIGVAIKSIVDFRINKRQLLFDARKKAYSGITGRIFNLFMEPDIVDLKENAQIFVRINILLSEVFLLGSEDLVELVGEYKVKIVKFHTLLSKKSDNEESKTLHDELVKLAGKIFDQM